VILALARGEAHLEDLATVPERRRAARIKAARWLDLLRATPTELALVESTLKITLFDADELYEIEESSRMFVAAGKLNLVAWLPVPDAAVPGNRPVGFIVDRHRLISMRHSDFHAFRRYAEPHRHGSLPRALTSAGLLIELVETIVGQLAGTLRSLEQDLNGLSLEIFSDPLLQGADWRRQTSFRNLKLIVQRLGRRNALAANLRESAVTLTTLIPFIISNGTRWIGAAGCTKFEILAKDLDSLREYNAQLSAEISFLLDSTMGLISIDQNQSMKFLGVAAVIVAVV
jgi:magnesium transporter